MSHYVLAVFEVTIESVLTTYFLKKPIMFWHKVYSSIALLSSLLNYHKLEKNAFPLLIGCQDINNLYQTFDRLIWTFFSYQCQQLTMAPKTCHMSNYLKFYGEVFHIKTLRFLYQNVHTIGSIPFPSGTHF